MLGIQKVIWLPHGIVNDETNEHVDNMACFLDEETVLLAMYKDENDLQYKWSIEAKSILENETLADGRKIKIILINCPNPFLSITKQEYDGIEQEGKIYTFQVNNMSCNIVWIGDDPVEINGDSIVLKCNYYENSFLFMASFP